MSTMTDDSCCASQQEFLFSAGPAFSSVPDGMIIEGLVTMEKVEVIICRHHDKA